jgi:hypothetical protein
MVDAVNYLFFQLNEVDIRLRQLREMAMKNCRFVKKQTIIFPCH